MTELMVVFIITSSHFAGSFESQVRESDVANILESGNINNTDSETNQETTSHKRKRLVSIASALFVEL